MSTCIANITNLITTGNIDNLIPLVSDVNSNFTISPLSSFIFLLQTSKNESIKFTISSTSTNSIINLTVTIFLFDRVNSTLVSQGNITVIDGFITFQKDLTEAEYLICIKANNNTSYTGYLRALFSNFQAYAKLSGKAYTSENGISILSFIPKELECTYPLYYEIIEGELPEGIFFSNAGMLYGTLPNLDCMEQNYYLSPSSNWYGTLISGESYPIGRAWRFKVRTYLEPIGRALDVTSGVDERVDVY